MITAVLDENVRVRIVGERRLIYTTAADPADDRPDHVRAASAMAVWRGKLAVIQDDASFLALVDLDRPEVDAIALPRGPAGRRRFEKALGNKLDKLDLEACITLDDDLIAFGSGSIAGVRDRIYRARQAQLLDAGVLYDHLRAAIGPLNIEGTAVVGDELWLFHRGNCGPNDRPAVAVVELAAFRAFLAGDAAPAITRVDVYDLGEKNHTRFGFTDATTRAGDVIVAFAAEASPDAIDDGAVAGSRIGIIDGGCVRCTDVAGPRGQALKIEAIELANNVLWLSVDCDDPAEPALLYEAVLDTAR